MKKVARLSNEERQELFQATAIKMGNMVEWFGKMVEERKKQHDCTKEKKNW